MPASTSPASLEDFRLPKAIETTEAGAVLHAALRRSAKKLWAGGALVAPVAGWSEALATALDSARRGGHLVRGLEQVETALAREARGLSMADARSPNVRGSRVSRLLLVSNDGSERFYRQVERLVHDQSPRLLAIRVEASAGAFADVVPEASGVVRAMLVEHKYDVVRVLGALYPSAAEV